MITVSALILDCIEQLRGYLREKSRENFLKAREAPGYLPIVCTELLIPERDEGLL